MKSSKLLKNIYEYFEGFWWSSYVTSKFTWYIWTFSSCQVHFFFYKSIHSLTVWLLIYNISRIIVFHMIYVFSEYNLKMLETALILCTCFTHMHIFMSIKLFVWKCVTILNCFFTKCFSIICKGNTYGNEEV